MIEMKAYFRVCVEAHHMQTDLQQHNQHVVTNHVPNTTMYKRKFIFCTKACLAVNRFLTFFSNKHLMKS